MPLSGQELFALGNKEMTIEPQYRDNMFSERLKICLCSGIETQPKLMVRASCMKSVKYKIYMGMQRIYISCQKTKDFRTKLTCPVLVLYFIAFLFITGNFKLFGHVIVFAMNVRKKYIFAQKELCNAPHLKLDKHTKTDN